MLHSVALVFYSRVGDAPDLDEELCSGGDEGVGEEGVPLYGGHRRVVSLVGPEVAGGVLCGAEVDGALLRTHQVLAGVVRLEGQGRPSV